MRSICHRCKRRVCHPCSERVWYLEWRKRLCRTCIDELRDHHPKALQPKPKGMHTPASGCCRAPVRIIDGKRHCSKCKRRTVSIVKEAPPNPPSGSPADPLLDEAREFVTIEIGGVDSKGNL